MQEFRGACYRGRVLLYLTVDKLVASVVQQVDNMMPKVSYHNLFRYLFRTVSDYDLVADLNAKYPEKDIRWCAALLQQWFHNLCMG